MCLVSDHCSGVAVRVLEVTFVFSAIIPLETTSHQGLYPRRTLVFQQPLVSVQDSSEHLEMRTFASLLPSVSVGTGLADAACVAARSPIPLHSVCAHTPGPFPWTDLVGTDHVKCSL